MKSRIIRRLRALFRRDGVESDLNDELGEHIRRQTESNIASGMAPDEAHYAALREFGGVEQSKEECREARRVRFIEEFVQDVRHGLRLLFKHPLFTVVSVAALGLGIGANTVIFSVVNAVLLRPLPFDDPDRLVSISETHPEILHLEASVPDYNDWASRSHSFSAMAAYSFQGFKDLILTEGTEPERLQGTMTTGNLFSVLGINPIVGRTFLPEEEQPGHDHVALISHALWQRRFGGDPAVLGRQIRLNGETFSVIGVMGTENRFPTDVDVWMPLSNIPPENTATRKFHSVSVVARLRPGSDLAQARFEMDSIAKQLQSENPSTNKSIGAAVVPLSEEFGGSLRTPLFVLLGSVGLVLLIACANVANLLLARAAARSKEIAIRSALGAGRGRLIRQFLTESVLLAAMGSVAGLVLALWTLPILKKWLPGASSGQVPRIEQVNIDLKVFGFAIILGVGTGILFGILPAIQLSRADLNETLKREARSAIGSSRRRFRGLLVIAEVALAVVVLAGAGLLLRTFRQLILVDPGFRTDHLLAAQIALPDSKYTTNEEVNSFFERMYAGIKSLPGVTGAASINVAPFVSSHAMSRFAVEGAPRPNPGQFPVAQIRSVDAGYFEMMGIALKSGRTFTEKDLTDQSQNSFVINETMARKYFPGKDPIGRVILMGVLTPQPARFQIVGVVADVRDLGVDTSVEPELYSAGQGLTTTVLVRTTVDPLSLSQSIRRAVLAADPQQPVSRVNSMDEILSESLARRAFSATLLGLFGVLALFLAAVGIYGVMAWTVTERTREIGLRMALGARRAGILGLVLRQGLLPVVIGLSAGMAAAVALTRIMSSMLYGVASTDPTTFIAVSITLLSIAFLAILIPAERATRIDPLSALREEN